MDTENTTNQSLKIQLSLASLMFFSPFIQHILYDTDFELTDQDRSFVKGYIVLGWINIGLFVLTICTGLIAYLYTNAGFSIVYQIIVGVLVAILCVESVCAVTETKIISTPSTSVHGFTEYTNLNKAHILLSYLPGYAIYLWYNEHNFDTPDILVKESIILRGVFMFACILPTPIIAIIIGIIIVVRIVSLLGNINIFPSSASAFLASLFYKNPEEIWAYLWGSVLFLIRGNYTLLSWKSLVENTKKEYQYLYDMRTFGVIQLEYVLLVILIGFLLRGVDIGVIPGVAIIAVTLLGLRYGLMIYMVGRSPSLPLLREIVALISPIITHFTSKK